MSRLRYAVLHHPSVRASSRRAVAKETRQVYRELRLCGASRRHARHVALGVLHAADMVATPLIIYAPTRGAA